jgi:nicotinamidase-related amidase
MAGRLLTPESVCIQVIDVQKSLMAKIYQAEKVTETVRLMISCAGILGVPVFGNTQYKKGLGPYVEEIEELAADFPVIDKTHFNAAANPQTAAHLAALPGAIDSVVLVGVETHICIYQTAMGLLDLGMQVWVVSDGVSSRKEVDHLAGIKQMERAGVTVGPAEMLVYELLGRADSKAFKEVLPHILARS